MIFSLQQNMLEFTPDFKKCEWVISHNLDCYRHNYSLLLTNEAMKNITC